MTEIPVVRNNSDGKRRKLLAALVASGGAAVLGSVPDRWTRPVVESVLLPAHATTTAPQPSEPDCVTQTISLDVRVEVSLIGTNPDTYEATVYLNDEEVGSDTFTSASFTIDDSGVVDGCTGTIVVENGLIDLAGTDTISGTARATLDCPGGYCTTRFDFALPKIGGINDDYAGTYQEELLVEVRCCGRIPDVLGR